MKVGHLPITAASKHMVGDSGSSRGTEGLCLHQPSPAQHGPDDSAALHNRQRQPQLYKAWILFAFSSPPSTLHPPTPSSHLYSFRQTKAVADLCTTAERFVSVFLVVIAVLFSRALVSDALHASLLAWHPNSLLIETQTVLFRFRRGLRMCTLCYSLSQNWQAFLRTDRS